MFRKQVMVAIAGLVVSATVSAQTTPSAPPAADKTKTVNAQPPAQTAPPAADKAKSVNVQPAAQTAPPASPFRAPDPLNFTADTPSVATVNEFLKQLWGYDPARLWQVQAIQKTQVPGLSRVTILIAQPGADPSKVQGSQFFVLPDGKHAIADDVISFGAQPFAENRETLKTRANGPSKGSASKDLMFVEFSDFQCPHCKDAQAIVEHLMQDFPNAHLAYENFPLRQIHPLAEQAAEYSVCVAKSNNDAFFKFANAVFDTQAGLTPEGATKTLNDAVTKAGLSPDQIAACVAQPQTKAAVDESVKLAQDLNVNSTPTLFVNGRPVPVSSAVPYETTKSIVSYQLQLDGLPQPAPKLNSLSK